MIWRLTTEAERRKLEQAHPSELQRFTEHQLVKICGGPRLHYWRCEPPGGGSYWFDLISTPGRAIIGGDIGDLVLRMSAWGHEWAAPPALPDFVAKVVTLPVKGDDWLGYIGIHYAAMVTFLRLLEAEQRVAGLRSAS